MNRFIPISSLVAFVALLALLLLAGPGQKPAWWWTPDQQADRLLQEKKYDEAARASSDPARLGTASYRAGDFKAAATAFARDSSAAGAFNHGNALMMLGKYADAIKNYDRALSLQPGWQAALDNREIAVLRRDRLKTEGGDATGGQVKADSFVFDKNKKSSGDPVQVNGGEKLSDDQLRAVWLQRVQTKPADFLRAKFAFQQQEAAAKEQP